MKKRTTLNKDISDRWTYTDIHTHIIPSVDDGARDMDETMDMISMSYDEGIRNIIATPHYGKWNPGYDRDKVAEIFDTMRRVVKSEYDDVDVHMGCEIYYSSGIVDDLSDGKAATMMDTDYVLIEFAVGDDYDRIYDGLKTVIIGGYRPILAHAERYQCLRNDLKDVEALIEQGVYIQVNTRNFLGKRFDKRAAWCRKLLKNGLIHFVASDCHDSGARTPVMKSAVEKMLEIADEEAVDRIVNTNIMKLMENKYI